MSELCTLAFEQLVRGGIIRLWAEIGSLHEVLPLCYTGLFQQLIPGEKGRPESTARIPGSWLNPDILKGPLPEKLSVAHTVESHTPSEAKMPHPGQVLSVPGHL